MLAVLPDLIFTLDTDGIIRYANPSAIESAGQTLETLVGRPFHDFCPEATEPVAAHLRQVLAGGRPVTADVLLHTTIGVRPFECVLSRLRADAVLLSARDITERMRDAHQVERDLAAAQQRLLDAESEKKRFYSEVILAVTHGKLHLMERDEMETVGHLALQADFSDPTIYAWLRGDLRDLAARQGMRHGDAEDFILAVGEAITNTIKHAEKGRCDIYLSCDRIVARVIDRGTGIHTHHLPATILTPGFSTQVSLGMGYSLMLALVDRICLATGPRGTVVQLAKWLHPEEHVEEPLRALMDAF